MATARLTRHLFLGGWLLATAGSLVAAEPVARIDGQPLHAEDIADYRAGLQSDPGRAAAMEELINRRLLLEAARERGLPDEEPIRRAMERARNDVLVQALLDRAVDQQVTPEAVRAYYQRHLGDGPQATQLGLRRFTTGQRSAAATAKERLAAGEEAPQVRRRGEGVEWVFQPLLPAAQRQALRQRGKSDLAGPVAADGQWQVIEVVRQRQVAPPPLATVRATIRQRLREQAVQDLLQRLRQSATIEYDSGS
ncbi:MAG TPA: peptidylprolyl isomerase [Gammaproteobacteria bacterium]|nr:peptidylprolyl isomerase [Gammaproteobacteria bacterium]